MLGGTRRAVVVAFAAQGFVLISLTTRLPDIAERQSLSEIALSGLLLLMIGGAGAGSVLAERVVGRTGSGAVLRAGLLGMVGAVPLVIVAPDAGFVAGLACYGVCLGIVDAAANMQAVALEREYERPILPSFHGAWTFGAMLGAGTTLATAGFGLDRAAWVVAVPLVAAAGRFVVRTPLDRATGPGRDAATEPTTDSGLDSATAPALDPALDDDPAWGPIVLVGLAMLVFYLVDTASTTWGAVYLDEVFDAPARLVALATFPYLAASLVARLAGDRLVRRYGTVSVLRWGAVVGCAGLVTVVAAPTWPAAVLGFTLTGLGVAVVAPLSFSAAAALAGGARGRVDAVIARFNQFNYAGAVLGSVLTGVVGAGSLRLGFVVPMVLVLAIIPLAGAFAPVQRASAPTPSAPTPAPRTL